LEKENVAGARCEEEEENAVEMRVGNQNPSDQEPKSNRIAKQP